MIDKKCEYTEWQTPGRVLSVVRDYMLIDLDPATSPDNPVKASWFFSAGGLEQVWSTYGNIFVNPPYGKVLAEWTDKIRHEAAKGAHIVALLPGQRFETRYWQENILTSKLSAICFIRSRLQFIRPGHETPGNNPFGSMLYIYNAPVRLDLDKFKTLGRVLFILPGCLR